MLATTAAAAATTPVIVTVTVTTTATTTTTTTTTATNRVAQQLSQLVPMTSFLEKKRKETVSCPLLCWASTWE